APLGSRGGRDRLSVGKRLQHRLSPRGRQPAQSLCSQHNWLTASQPSWGTETGGKLRHLGPKLARESINRIRQWKLQERLSVEEGSRREACLGTTSLRRRTLAIPTW